MIELKYLTTAQFAKRAGLSPRRVAELIHERVIKGFHCPCGLSFMIPEGELRSKTFLNRRRPGRVRKERPNN